MFRYHDYEQNQSECPLKLQKEMSTFENAEFATHVYNAANYKHT